MAEFMEVISDNVEDAGKNVKKTWGKLKNNKLFLFGCAGAAVLGVIALMQKNKSSEEVAEYSITPTGYTGYPATESGGGSTAVSYSDMYYAMDELQAGLTDVFADEFANIYSQLDTFQDEVEIAEIYNRDAQEANKISVVEQMRNNANYYALTGDSDTREYLKVQNETLGASIGATKDADGYWHDSNGTLLFTPDITYEEGQVYQAYGAKSYNANTDYAALIDTANRQGWDDVIANLEEKRMAKIVGEGLNEYVSYDKTVDYAQAIIDAQARGASETEINYLKMQRNAKIEGEGLSQEKSVITSTSSGGSSSSSKTSSSGGSVKSAGHTDHVTPSNASSSAYAVTNPKTGKLNYTATKKAEMAAKKKKR